MRDFKPYVEQPKVKAPRSSAFVGLLSNCTLQNAFSAWASILLPLWFPWALLPLIWPVAGASKRQKGTPPNAIAARPSCHPQDLELKSPTKIYMLWPPSSKHIGADAFSVKLTSELCVFRDTGLNRLPTTILQTAPGSRYAMLRCYRKRRDFWSCPLPPPP